MTDVAIIGATGYGGLELIRLLHAHPQVRLSYLHSETYAGQMVRDVYPHLGQLDLRLQKLDAEAAAQADFVLLAIPAGEAMAIVPEVLASRTRVIDVSPDFRLRDAATYEHWYGLEHACPDLLAEAVFGVPELYREAIASARLVAAPGCYTTAALLAVAPLLSAGLIEPGDIIVDGKTGVSGAGRTSLKLSYHFPEADEDVSAYSVGGHRHAAEITQELSTLTEGEVGIAFTPHLVPMSRGILMTAYALPTQGTRLETVRDRFAARYAEEPFVHVLPEAVWPHTKWTTGTNHCFVAAAVDEISGRLVVVSAIDNVGKGQAGQMVQCLNLMMGVDETTGLNAPAVYP
jgi:N-acetyl-gamma-glutamyl-phosphate reductase